MCSMYTVRNCGGSSHGPKCTRASAPFDPLRPSAQPCHLIQMRHRSHCRWLPVRMYSTCQHCHCPCPRLTGTTVAFVFALTFVIVTSVKATLLYRALVQVKSTISDRILKSFRGPFSSAESLCFAASTTSQHRALGCGSPEGPAKISESSFSLLGRRFVAAGAGRCVDVATTHVAAI